jgi:hypothetical protein
MHIYTYITYMYTLMNILIYRCKFMLIYLYIHIGVVCESEAQAVYEMSYAIIDAWDFALFIDDSIEIHRGEGIISITYIIHMYI